MKKNGFSKFTSIILTLCIVMSCVAFSFSTVGAATLDDDSSAVSATAVEPNANFTWDNATVYFLLTDRFKNGNTSNDHSYNRGLDQNGNVVQGIDESATFHGGDFAGITQSIKEGYFTDLGVNALWISAPYEQIHGYVVGGDGSPSFAHYAYHGYYVLDYTQTDANFGTAEEFETMVDTAHEYGLRVIIDIVLNHAGYNSVYDMVEYGFGTVKSGWESAYYDYKNISNATYHANIDYDGSATDWAKWWGPDWIRCGVAGYTEGGGDDRTRTLEGLPDFKTESTGTVDIPQLLKTKWAKEGRLTQETNELKSYLSKHGKAMTVTNSIAYWLSTWVRDYGVDGFRCDTAKHVDFASWKTVKDFGVEALKEWRKNNPSKPGANWDEDFWMTGECWDHGVNKDGYYTEGGFDSMINFSTQGGGLVAQGTVKGTYNGFAEAINNDPDFNVLSYISSHDSVLARGDLISTGSAFLMLPGGVQIYYGDETNRPLDSSAQANGQHNLRSDMNWDSIDQKVLSHWQKVGTFRNNHVAVGAGSNTDLTSSSGYAFGRTYSKDSTTDKVAGVIYASANTDVTIDVSPLWKDGQYLVNAYDQSSAVVTNGKVTFNSGENKTILIQEPDGRPLMSVKGSSMFVGNQTVTVSIEECDSAKASVDGGNKFVVKNGSTFEIGDTAYNGDTVVVTLEGSNEKGTSKSSFSFKKVTRQDMDDATTPTEPPEPSKLVVKTWDGSAPYAYVWTGASTAQNGEWPGKQLTQKDSDGNYVLELNTTETYNVVLHNNAGGKSSDIKGLNGTAVVEVTNSSYATKIVSNGSGGGSTPTDASVTIHVKPYGNTTPSLYVWTDTDGALLGTWPGTTLSEKDEDGNYVVTIPNQASVNAIVKGSGQTSDITGLSGDVLIEITNEDCTAFKLTKNVAPVSGMALLKQEGRSVKAMTANDYTADSWSKVSSLMPTVDSLVAQGDEADESEITAMISKLQTAKAGLKLATPTLSYAVAGKTGVKGYAAPASTVSVTVGSSTTNVTADDVTGEFVVPSASVSRSTTIKAAAARNDVSSATLSYNMSSGDITNGNPPTQPTQETKATQPTQATEDTKETQATKPTQTPDKQLIITADSNFFPTSTNNFDSSTDTVTVTYYINSAKAMLDTQWTLSFDPTVLKYNASKNENVTDFMPGVSGGTLANTDEAASGEIYGSFASTSLAQLTKDGKEVAFVSITFDVLKHDSTTVGLYVETLDLSDNNDNDEMIVDDGRVVSHQTDVKTSTNSYKGTYTDDVTPTQPTEPTTAPSKKLVVNATSNLFSSSSQSFDKSKDTVTITYYINSTKSLENIDWKLTYDPKVLAYNESKNENVDDFMPTVINGAMSSVNTEKGVINGNCATLKLAPLSNDGKEVALVTVTFDVLKQATTTVNLNVNDMTIASFNSKGKYDDSTEETLVYDSKVNKSSALKSATSKVYEGQYSDADGTYMYGDLNMDGQITVVDASIVQKYIAGSIELTDLQKKLGDVNGDGTVSVLDSGAIQKYIAGYAKGTGKVGQLCK